MSSSAPDSGAAGRTRFGVAPPRPLSALGRNTIALSDVILVRSVPSEPPPTTVQQTLTHMYGSTRLDNPARLALFWEVCGQRDGDTVEVSVRIIRRSTANVVARAAAAIGLGRAADDTVLVQWREPRPGDPLATVDGGGVTIRPRSVALDVSALEAGDYTVTVQVARSVTVASNPREFTIVRR